MMAMSVRSEFSVYASVNRGRQIVCKQPNNQSAAPAKRSLSLKHARLASWSSQARCRRGRAFPQLFVLADFAGSQRWNAVANAPAAITIACAP